MSDFEWGTTWPKIKIKGKEYDLSHIDPFPIKAIPGDPTAPTINIGVSFTHHAFTRERSADDGPDLIVTDREGNDPRSFCEQRYKCSFHLPDIIRSVATGSVTRSRDGRGNWNYMIVSQIDCAEGEYATVFQLGKSSGRFIPIRMRVISAHERKRPLGEMRSISFYSVVRRVLNE